MQYRDSDPSGAKDSPGISKIKPPSIFLACLLGGLAFECILPPGAFQPALWMQSCGLLLFAAGFAIMGTGHKHFKTLKVSVKTCLPAGQLVRSGIYRFTRNPMYLGFCTILVALGLAAGSLWLALSVFPMFAYLSLYVIPREEAYLLRQFGQDYDAYCKSTRRWI